MNAQQKNANAQFFLAQFGMITEGVWIWKDHPECCVYITGNGKPTCSPQTFAAIGEITPRGWCKKHLKIDKNIKPYLMDKANEIENMIETEIAKHKRLIESNKEALTKVHIGKLAASLTKQDDMMEKADSRIGFCETHITHSNLMIDLFNHYSSGRIPEMRECITKVKENAIHIERFMEECVKHEYYTEQEYKLHMDRFYAELKLWERFQQ